MNFILRDPWTIRHPILCRIALLPISFLILLIFFAIPATTESFRTTYGTIFSQYNVYVTLLLIRILPFHENTILTGVSIMSVIGIFVVPQILYSYHVHRKPREGQIIWIFLIVLAGCVFYHGHICRKQFEVVMDMHSNGHPVSEKDMYKIAGKPVYWRYDSYSQRLLGFYTDGRSATYIKRNEKGHFEIQTPHLWLD